MSTSNQSRTCLACQKTIQRSIYPDYHKVCAHKLGLTPTQHTATKPSVASSVVQPTATHSPTANQKQPVKQNTGIKNNQDFIPTTNGYITRKINKKTDIELFEIAYKNKINSLLVGDTGTGKTHAVRHFCFENKLPYMRVNLNEATTVEDLVGQWIPNPEGGFKWEDGVLTRFMRYGGVFVCDEINAANSGVLFILHSVLDDERKIVLVQKDGSSPRTPKLLVYQHDEPRLRGNQTFEQRAQGQVRTHTQLRLR